MFLFDQYLRSTPNILGRYDIFYSAVYCSDVLPASEKNPIGPLLMAAAVLGTIVIYFIASLIRHQRINVKLNQEKVEAEIITLENERRRIAADLHDEVGPMLSGIKLMISSLEVDNESGRDRISKVKEYIDHSIQRMREISNNLLPAVLEKRGILEALHQLFVECQKVHGIMIQFSYDENIMLSSQRQLHLYRILQEILHNTIKHSEARTLRVELLKSNKSISLYTEDDGKGFDIQDRSQKGKGLGMRNLHSRAELLSGNMYIESVPSKGTRITLNFPSHEQDSLSKS
ncbi:MAG: sensor histidine kinase [Saprospiraceae bacterium]|nr:sensor histidine kinase [Saprospiraceae bacterium]